MKIKIKYSTFCLFLVLLGAFAAGAQAEPQLSESFWGTVVLQDSTPVPAPATVSAVVTNGGGYLVTTEAGEYGDYDYTLDRLVVGGTGIPPDAPISFFVNGVPAECNDGNGWGSTYPFESGVNVELALRVTGTAYTISAYSGPHGTIDPTGDVKVAEGGSRTFEMVPDNCYAVQNVLVDGVPYGAVPSYTFTNVRQNHTIEVSFQANPPVITAIASAGGSIAPSGTTSVPCGASQAYVIVPQAPCFVIDDVHVDGVSVGVVSGYSFSDVVSNHNIEAFFSPVNTTITATSGEGGTIAPSGSVVAPCGGSQTFTFTPYSCSIVDKIIVDGEEVDPAQSYTFTNVTAPHTISVSFRGATLTINATSGEGGTIEPSGLVSVPCGGSQSFTIVPGGCSQIADVLVDGVSVGAVPEYRFVNVTTPRTIRAVFTYSTSTVTATAGQGGAITPSGPVQVPCGDAISFSIAPDSCHTIGDVVVDGVSKGPVSSYQFSNVTEPHRINASFSAVTYPITTNPGPHGNIFPEGPVNVPCGTNITFFFMPESRYHVQEVYVDGVSIGYPSSYTFSQVTSMHNLSATFAEGGPIYFTTILQWSQDSPWNLFSTPVNLDDSKDALIDIFPQKQNIEAALGWDGQKWFQPGPNYILRPMDAIYIRVNANTPAYLYPSQSVTAPPSRPLPAGISLIGPAPAYDERMAMFPTQPLDYALISIEEAQGNLTGYTMVISPALNQPGWAYGLGGEMENLLPYKGYWVAMTNPDTMFGFSTTPIL